MITKYAAAALLSVSLVLTACNTIGGIGRDIESVGDTIADEAE